MSKVTISDAVRYIGCDDHDIDLFESQYLVPNGVSYNSYLIVDEKIAVMDTVDARAGQEWLANLEQELAQKAQGRQPDYLVVSHLEPDHAANIQKVCERYPELKVVSNAKSFSIFLSFSPWISVSGSWRLRRGIPCLWESIPCIFTWRLWCIGRRSW